MCTHSPNSGEADDQITNKRGKREGRGDPKYPLEFAGDAISQGTISLTALLTLSHQESSREMRIKETYNNLRRTKDRYKAQSIQIRGARGAQRILKGMVNF